MVKFSIITPFYMGNKYVPDLVQMAEKNAITLEEAGIDGDVELIIVNDSPSEKVKVPEYSSKISVRVINQEKNGGIHYARVTGLAQSQGEFVVFLDQDDVISDKCILKEYETIEDNDIVVANALFEYSDGRQILHFKRIGQYRNAFELAPYVKGHNRIISPGHCLIRKKAIPREWTEYIMKTNGSDDLFLWLLMLLRKAKFVMYCEPLYIHRYTGENLSAEAVKMAESTLELAEYLKQIEYVPASTVKNIIRSRSMRVQMENKCIIHKALIIVKNIDIFFWRIVWKLRAKTGKLVYDVNDMT